MVLILTLNLSQINPVSNNDWSVICVNDERPQETSFPIEIIEEGTMICLILVVSETFLASGKNLFQYPYHGEKKN